MQRVVFLVVVALLGGAALAGCGRAEPDVAAYVGKQRFSIQQVETLAKEAGERLGDYAAAQRSVVGWLVIRSVGQRMAQDEGWELELPAELDEFARQRGLQAGSPVAKLFLETISVLQTIEQTVAPVDPTEADQREVYQNLTINGQPVTDPFENVQQFLTAETIGRSLGVRKVLSEQLDRSDVVVNPRYTPMRFPIEVRVGQVPGVVYLPLDAGSVASDAR
jgi:hypothetical protein